MNMDFNYMIGIQQLSCWGRGCKKEGMGRGYNMRNSSQKKMDPKEPAFTARGFDFLQKGRRGVRVAFENSSNRNWTLKIF